MFSSIARAAVLVAASAMVAACDTSTRAPEHGNALVPGASQPAPVAEGTSGPQPAADVAATEIAEPKPADASRAAEPSPAGAGAVSENAAAAPRYREVTIPAGTVLSVRLNTGVGSDTSRPEQRVDGTLARDVRIGGAEVIDAGAALRGIVTNAERSGRVKGRANVSFRFNQLITGGETYGIRTQTVTRVAPPTKKRDAATVGIPAAGGAIVGGIIGGGKGAVKGGAIGGAAGTAAVLSTRGKEVRLAPGTTVTVRLASPLTVRVR
jgi:hypothetical protein